MILEDLVLFAEEWRAQNGAGMAGMAGMATPPQARWWVALWMTSGAGARYKPPHCTRDNRLNYSDTYVIYDTLNLLKKLNWEVWKLLSHFLKPQFLTLICVKWQARSYDGANFSAMFGFDHVLDVTELFKYFHSINTLV